MTGQPPADPATPPGTPDLASRRVTIRQGLTVGVASGVYGISFGALSVAAGLSMWQTQALSALMFTGGSQFALVAVIAAGGGAWTAIGPAALLGVRNGLYGLQMSRVLGAGGVRRLLAAQLTIDESTAVALGQSRRELSRLGFWVTGAAVFTFWNAATLLGAVIGNAVGDPRRWGLDAAAAAAFVALLWPRLQSRDAAATAALAVVITVLAVPWAPAGVPVLVAALAALVVGWLPDRREVGP